MKFIKYLYIVIISCLILNCGDKTINSVDKLVKALKKNGIQYLSIEAITTDELKLTRFDEAYALHGENLWLEIYRIENEMIYKTSIAAVMLRMKFDKSEDNLSNKPHDIFVRKPFLVMIIQEPENGKTKQALQKIFPEDTK
jgi:hypothetical protein